MSDYLVKKVRASEVFKEIRKVFKERYGYDMPGLKDFDDLAKERIIEHISYWHYLRGKYRSDLDQEWKNNLKEKDDINVIVSHNLVDAIESIDYRHSNNPKHQPLYRNAQTLRIIWEHFIKSGS